MAAARASSASLPFSPPSSILIIGSGVFGLTTALALTRRQIFANCSITVVDRADPSQPGAFPSPDAASTDSSRIIRADYADPAYAALGEEAQTEWCKQNKPTDLGAQGRYHEAGLVLVADAAPADGAPSSKKKTGMDYARQSWANVLSLASKDPALASRIRELPNPDAIRDAVGTGGSSGSWGYLNQNSGWADAAASMAWLFDKVQQTGRVNFVAGTVVSLAHNDTAVTGARLSDGRVLHADLVVVAAGAWTGGLVDLGGQAVATAQVMGYLELTESEQAQLSRMPVLLNLSTGLFVMPPTTNRILKVARHAYGYINPTPIDPPPLPLSPQISSPKPTTPVSISLPRTHLTSAPLPLPAEGASDLRRALREMVPLPSLADRPFAKTRLCWYSDTATADFLVDYHPRWRGLFVATGDSGHAFKFLPVLGDKIADCIARARPPQFEDKWEWKEAAATAAGVETPVVTEDGSRGGVPYLVLADELAKTPVQ
ncbi:hypothetical protein VTK56DRAFT_7357 [Thermocarpiscus australiensis]